MLCGETSGIMSTPRANQSQSPFCSKIARVFSNLLAPARLVQRIARVITTVPYTYEKRSSNSSIFSTYASPPGMACLRQSSGEAQQSQATKFIPLLSMQYGQTNIPFVSSMIRNTGGDGRRYPPSQSGLHDRLLAYPQRAARRATIQRWSWSTPARAHRCGLPYLRRGGSRSTSGNRRRTHRAGVLGRC